MGALVRTALTVSTIEIDPDQTSASLFVYELDLGHLPIGALALTALTVSTIDSDQISTSLFESELFLYMIPILPYAWRRPPRAT